MDFSTVIAQAQQMGVDFVKQVPNIIVGLIVLGVFWGISRYAKRFIGNFVSRGEMSDAAGVAFGRISSWIIMILGVLIAMIIIFPSLDIAALLGSLGVGGVVIGFAFRDILQNFFAGLILLLQEPFSIGDQIIVEGYEGTVRKIDLRATTIHTYDSRDVLIPNAELFTDSVLVNTAHKNRRSQYDVGIGYGDDIDRAANIMLDAVKQADGVLSDPAPDVKLMELGDFAVVLRARWWTPSDRKSVIGTHDKVLRAIKYAFDDAGIDMPYPTHVTLFHNQTEKVDGDRTRQREGWPVPENGSAPKAQSAVD